MTKSIKKDPNKWNGCYYDIGELEAINGLQLKMKHKTVLWALDSYGEKIFPSRLDIARKSSCGTQTVDAALRDLKKVNVVMTQRRFGTSSIYLLNRNLIRTLATEARESKKIQKEKMRQEFDETRNAWSIGVHEIRDTTDSEGR
jgi:hypothetical protein